EGFPQLLHTCPSSGAETNLMKLTVDRGVSFQAALAKLSTYQEEWQKMERGVSPECGFWVSTYVTNWAQTGMPRVLMATEIWRTSTRGTRTFRIQRPNNCDSLALALPDLSSNYRKATAEEVKELWAFWYEFALQQCDHGLKCKSRAIGAPCTRGMRMSTVCLISGAVLPVWAYIDSVFKAMRHKQSQQFLRVVRTVLLTGERIVGLNIPEEAVEQVVGAVEALDGCEELVAQEGGGCAAR
ncbi:hypothetical protein CYMTET_49334, partial [Cymbomonas tetramitiformis]